VKVAAVAFALGALLWCQGATAVVRVPRFEHVIVIVFENKEAGSVIGNREAPTFNAYFRRYAAMTRYYGVTHPSLPNYLALVSGATQGITSDCTACTVRARSLADTLEAAGLGWKTYAEGYPSSARYAKKHNPFLYFRGVDRSRVVPLTELSPDLAGGKLPDFSLVVPDLCNSMHDCPVEDGDDWLRRIAPPLLKFQRTAIFVIFDEGTTSVRGGGHTAALVIGTAVRPGARYVRPANHYSVLRTIETAWGLPLLGHSAAVSPITGIWR
jgi:acid phosphatase